MNNPSWQYFRQHTQQEELFEKDVAKRLFCEEAGIAASQITCPKNYPGIENIPVESNGIWIAFQAKHSNDGRQNVNSFASLTKVIEKKQSGEYQLDKIFCYSSGSAPTNTMTKPQKKFCQKLKESGIEVEWFYEDQILSILQDTDSRNLTRASQAFFEDLPQPGLNKQEPMNSPEGSLRLRFSERQSEFVDRDTEQVELREFTETDELISWWYVTGPGFSGKSRLLLEHCLSLEEWNWGWLQPEMTGFSFESWLPNRDTFVVIDYVSGREEHVQKFFYQLRSASRSDRFVHKVRIVMLERENADWLRSIEGSPDLGNWLADRKHRTTGLVLERLPAALSQLDDVNSADDSSDNFSQRVSSFLEREQSRRWSDASSDAKLSLVLATASGGFNLNNLRDQVRPETMAFVSSLSSSDEVARMAGVPHANHDYPPLEPDPLGELLVLNHLDELNPLGEERDELLRRAYDLNPTGLVNFLYRSANSFPDHPAVASTLSDWSFDRNSKIAVRTILANGINNPSLSQDERIAKYRQLLEPIEAPSPDLIFIERIIFTKILALFPSSNLEIVPGEVRFQQEIEVPAERGTDSSRNDVIESLLPEVYCIAVIQSWTDLEETTRLALFGPHLIEVFQHHAVRRMATNRDVETVGELVRWLVENLNAAGNNRYSATIFAFQQMAANVVASMVQFNTRSPNALQLAEDLRSYVRNTMTLERAGQPLVCNTTYIDRLDLALSVMASLSNERDYQYKLDRLQAIRGSGIGIQPDQTQKMSLYVQTAVQACHGFSTPEEIKEILQVLQNARQYYATVRTPQIATAFNMMLNQLARETAHHDLGITELELLTEAADVAKSFPNPELGTAAMTVLELCNAFERYVLARDYELAIRAQELALEVLRAADTQPHEPTKRLFCGALLDSVCRAYLDGWDALMPTVRDVASYLSSAPSVAWEQMINAHIQPFSKYYEQAMQALSSNDPERAERCVDILRLYADFDPSSNNYAQVIELIMSKLETDN